MLQAPLRRLQDEIRATELRIIDSDQRLAAGLHHLRATASRALSLKLIAGAGLLAAGWLLRRPARRHAGAHAVRAPRTRTAVLLGAVMGAQRWLPMLLPLAAPLLNRKVALLLGGLGLPVAARKLTPLRTVPALDLKSFSGLWFEIARLPQRNETPGRHDASLHYGLDAEGVAAVQRWLDEEGRLHERRGRVRAADPDHPGELELSFAPPWLRWWPGAWDDHWVLYVDRDYRCAVVGSPERDRLCVLAREPQMPEEALQALHALADKLGFDSARLRRTPHA